VKGRKRHLVVDSNGLLLHAEVHAADVQDRVGARSLLQAALQRYPKLQVVWADGGYSGTLESWVQQCQPQARLEIVPRHQRDRFVPLPRRWVVERTFAWLGRFRRLSRDYEFLPRLACAFILLAMSDLMLSRITTTF